MIGVKVCTRCKIEKPLTEFYTRRSTARTPPKTPAYDTRCRTCHAAKVTARMRGPKRALILMRRKAQYARRKAEGRANEGYADRMYRRLYRSSEAAYDVQLAGQNGCCAICGRVPAPNERRFPFDHDHDTGLTRGVLCAACNGGLGCFRDTPELLRAAISYLQHWTVDHAKRVVNE